MNEPVWISAEEAVAINKLLVAQFGGLDAGVRDENLLRAALARPLNKWHYETPQPSIHMLAAAYAFAIGRGHVFHDGNKRTAYTVAATFLDINAVICAPDKADAVERMVAVAEGTLSEREIAEWFARNNRPVHGLSEVPAEAPLPASKTQTRLSRRKPKSPKSATGVRKRPKARGERHRTA